MMNRMSQPADLPNETSEGTEPAAAETPLPQPAGSPITIERFADGLTITVPPAGLWKGTHGLFLFAILWNGFMGVFTPLLLVGIFSGKGVEQGAALIAPAVLSIFWLVGIGILLGALNMGRRQAAIAVTSCTLMVIQTGLFGTKQRQWAAPEIRRICAGHSGMEVNDKPILELQIFGQGAGKFGLLAGRTDEELNWIASELRVALGVV
jgi:hypothetical protein